MGFNEVEKTFEDGHVVTFKRIGMSEFYSTIQKLDDPKLAKNISEIQEELKTESITEERRDILNRELSKVNIESDFLVRGLVKSKVVGIRNADKQGTQEDGILFIDCLMLDKIQEIFMAIKPDFEKNLPSQS